MQGTLHFTICIGSTPTFLHFDWYICDSYARQLYIYVYERYMCYKNLPGDMLIIKATPVNARTASFLYILRRNSAQIYIRKTTFEYVTN